MFAYGLKNCATLYRQLSCSHLWDNCADAAVKYELVNNDKAWSWVSAQILESDWGCFLLYLQPKVIKNVKKCGHLHQISSSLEVVEYV